MSLSMTGTYIVGARSRGERVIIIKKSYSSLDNLQCTMSGLLDLLWLFLPLIMIRWVLPMVLRLIGRFSGTAKGAAAPEGAGGVFPPRKRTFRNTIALSCSIVLSAALLGSLLPHLLQETPNDFRSLGLDVTRPPPQGLLQRKFDEYKAMHTKADPHFSDSHECRHLQAAVDLLATELGRHVYHYHGPQVFEPSSSLCDLFRTHIS